MSAKKRMIRRAIVMHKLDIICPQRLNSYKWMKAANSNCRGQFTYFVVVDAINTVGGILLT
jgi:hypothetical protein